MSIRQVAHSVWKSLGPGYSESVYHNAFEVGLRAHGLSYETERIVPVYYLDQNVGHVRADLIVDRRTVIELKSVSKINESYRIQTRNYMDLLGLDHAYLINFPDRVSETPDIEEFRRPKPPLDRIDC
jgi:GxxExxY protein